MIPKIWRGRLLGQLGFRLMTAVAIALTPLALLAYFQTEKLEHEAQARWQSSLFGDTLLAATPQIEKISRAQGLAAATAAAVGPILSDNAACIALMQELVSLDASITFAGVVPVDGVVTCGSSGVPLDLKDDPGLARLNENPRPVMTVSPKGRVSGESVLIFSHPIRDTADAVTGYVSLSLSHKALQTSGQSGDNSRLGDPLALVTFDGSGTILTTMYARDTVQERLPADHTLQSFVDKPPTTFVARTPQGDVRSFAVLPIVSGSLYVLGSWRASEVVFSPLSGGVPIWAFPLAMWVASMLAAWLAAEHQVLRPVRALRKSITAFAGGSRVVLPPNLALAPNELRDVGEAYERMMSSVIRDEAELENSLHQKEVLLREVHHRVKNNLQLIASIMNLQMRKSVSPEARQLLKGLHDRVMSLATVHRELYQTSGLTDVQVDELLQTIVAQVVRMGASNNRQVETQTSFDRIRMTPDQVVPLSLILTEALTNALKHSGQNVDAKTTLAVSFHLAAPGRAVLEILNSMPAAGQRTMPRDVERTGLGHQLLTAFATQLSGTLDVGERDGNYAVRVEFPLQSTMDPVENDTGG